jgi:hypothetical protein
MFTISPPVLGLTRCKFQDRTATAGETHEGRQSKSPLVVACGGYGRDEPGRRGPDWRDGPPDPPGLGALVQ